MSKTVILLLTMLFFHLLDDYKLQGILANFKQKQWWKENAPSKLYKYDWIIALIEHAFSWTFMVHIPLFVFYWGQIPIVTLLISVVLNLVCHAVVDDAKANRYVINLITDQLLHIVQIVITWFIWIKVI